jgi:tetratricopeptide (TPR) repeat protein
MIRLEQIKQQEKLFILLPIFLAFICFSNTLNHQFVYDDLFQVIEAAPALGDWSKENLVRLFDRDCWGFVNQHLPSDNKIRSQYYRPMQSFFSMIVYLYSGINPLGWHITLVVLHLIAIFFSYKAVSNSLKLIFPNEEEKIRFISLITTIFFAIHPAQTESIAWVAVFNNPLIAIFIFISLIAYLRVNNSYLWLFVSSLFYILALMTKEAAIMLPAILFFYEVLLISQTTNLFNKLRGAIAKLLPFAVITVGYFYIRIIILGSITGKAASLDFPGMENFSLIQSLATLPTILLTYLRILIWPFSNNPMYENRFIIEPNFINFYLPLFLILMLSFLAIISAFKHKILQLSLIWLVIPLIPVMNVRSFKPEDLVHDRYLYFSLIGFGMIFAFLINELNNLQEHNKTELVHPLLKGALVVLTLVMCLATIKQNKIWATEWDLWSKAYENVPDSCTVNLELGRLSEENKQDDQMALLYYQKAKSVCSDSLMLSYKMGMLYGRIGNLENSEISFQNMLKLANNRFIKATAYFNLALINEKRGNLKLAIDNYTEGLKLDPQGKNSKQVEKVVQELKKELNEKPKEEPTK